jgi:hypothetical protein
MLLTAWGLKAGSSAYTGGKQVNEAREKLELLRERRHVRRGTTAQ